MSTVAPPRERRLTPVDQRAAEEGVLEVLRELLAEIRGGPPPGPVALDDLLDRDLGLGSLERVEILLRLEKRFGVDLPDAVLAEAERGRDLVAAVLRGSARAPERPIRPLPRPASATPAPESARTLVEALRARVEAEPGRTHIFLRGDDGHERPIGYGELWERSSSIAAGLRERGLRRGGTVALMLRTEEGFFAAFFGALLAGGVPVPLYPPLRADRIEEFARRQAAILRNAGAGLLVTFAEAAPVARLLRARVPALREWSRSTVWPWPGRVPFPSRGRPTTPPSSSTRPAARAIPRACSSPTRTSSPTSAPSARPSGSAPTTSGRAGCPSTTTWGSSAAGWARSTSASRSSCSRRSPSSPIRYAGSRRSTPTRERSPPLRTSPSTSARARSPTRSWRASTCAPGAWPSTGRRPSARTPSSASPGASRPTASGPRPCARCTASPRRRWA